MKLINMGINGLEFWLNPDQVVCVKPCYRMLDGRELPEEMAETEILVTSGRVYKVSRRSETVRQMLGAI